MRAEAGRVGVREGFEILPEGSGVFFVPGQVVGASERKSPPKTGRLPDEFDIGDWKLGERERDFPGFVGSPVFQFPGQGECEVHWSHAEEPDFTGGDLVRFGKEGGFPFPAQFGIQFRP